ncbi:MAG: cytochrome C oxidase subunit IV [Crocinitomicaceae bacterium]|nr:cytochrome C oxidase subunit IV [Crocinitomicaceae bacterium]|tara:strand:- start:8061 stop:8417 length:357 start_codon:yes stop_codon:yes gene_type:complete
MKRDDIIEYSLGAEHSEEAGKAIRKKIWFVTAILSVVTVLEVLLGVYWTSMGLEWWVVKFAFIGLTVLKAGYIVMVFMHLGDERKMFKYFILLPYAVFILYLLYLLFTEAVFLSEVLT